MLFTIVSGIRGGRVNNPDFIQVDARFILSRTA